MEHIITEGSEEFKPLLEKIAREGVGDNAEIIYCGRNTIYRLRDGNGNDLSIKEFHNPRFPNSYIYTTFRHSKARRSFENATRLRNLGFDSPEPLGYVEVRQGHKLTRSYYLCRHLAQASTTRYINALPFAKELEDGIAQEMVKLHKQGVYHKDFSPGNILFTRNNETGEFKFFYVDVNRMEFGVDNARKLMSMFRSICSDENETASLAKLYARHAGLSEKAVVADAVSNLHAFLRKKMFLRRLKKMFRPQR